MPFVPRVVHPPFAVHSMPYRDFLPSVSSFLPFYFLLAHLSALFLFLLTPSFFPFVAHVFSRSFSAFPPRLLAPACLCCSHSISLPLPLFPPRLLPFSPTSSRPLRFPTFGAFNPRTNTPCLPHLASLDPTSRTHLLALLEELHSSRAPRITWGSAQDEIPGWVARVLDVGEGVSGLGQGRGGKGSLGFFQKLMVLKDGKEQGEWKEGELGSRTVSSFLPRIFFLFFSFHFFRRFSLIICSSFLSPPHVCVLFLDFSYLSTRFLYF